MEKKNNEEIMRKGWKMKKMKKYIKDNVKDNRKEFMTCAVTKTNSDSRKQNKTIKTGSLEDVRE